MELKEDLIIIEAEKAKDKLYNLKAEIENAKGNLKAFLCDLFDIYMFQVFSGGMPKSSDEKNSIPEGEDEMIHSDLTKKEWDELQEWRKGIDASFKEDLEESKLEEANYMDQVDKMKKLEAGTRGFNAKAASDEKLRLNQQICKSYNLPTALAIVEDEMRARGILGPKQPQPAINPDKIIIHLELMDFHGADARFVKDAETTEAIIKNCMAVTGSIKQVLISLVWALCLQKPSEFIQALRLFLTENCSYSNSSIKETINECLSNSEIVTRLNQITQEVLK